MAELAGLVQRLEVAVGRLEAASGSGGGPASPAAPGATAAFVGAYEDIISGPVAHFMALSKQIGGDVLKQAELIQQGFVFQKQLLATASGSQKPNDATLTALLKPVSKVIEQAQVLRENLRSSPHFNHLSAVSESVPAFGWVAMAPKPGPFVKEMQDAAMFYTNRVLKDFKEKDKTHVDWVKAYLAIWLEVQTYIKTHHTTGLTWSKTGPVASAGPASGAPAPPPPPPGPPPPPAPVASSGSSGGGEENRGALFAAINQGSNITSGLKHVSDTEKTHKNPNLRGQAPVRTGPKPFTAGPASSPRAAPAAARKQPPVLELDGKKWKVENQDNVEGGLEISETELKQVVYAYKCSNTTLRVKGKINSITLDNCSKLGLVFDDAVGIVDVINCRDVKVQVMGKVPTISINKTDGCHVYLSKDSLECVIISAKSSEMNILVPGADGEFTELPVPEQFRTVWDGKKLVTTATEIAG